MPPLRGMSSQSSAHMTVVKLPTSDNNEIVRSHLDSNMICMVYVSLQWKANIRDMYVGSGGRVGSPYSHRMIHGTADSVLATLQAKGGSLAQRSYNSLGRYSKDTRIASRY